MESKKTVRLHHITLMRVFAIVGVVMFHTYQMTWANHLPEPMRSVMYDMYFTPINCWLINISMPMFVAVSGYLFFWQLERGKIGSWGVLLRKKSLRLLAPYFVFAIAMMFTTNNYHNWMLLISGNYSHLWFLPALFWWFFVAYALRWVLCRWWGWCGFFAIFAVVSYMCGRFLPLIMGMNFLTTVWFFFFLIGGV